MSHVTERKIMKFDILESIYLYEGGTIFGASLVQRFLSYFVRHYFGQGLNATNFRRR